MLSIGVYLLVAAVAVLVAFWTAQFGTWGRVVAIVGGVVAVLALLLGARLAVRPPVVLTLNEQGYHGRVRATKQLFEGRWKDVRDVQLGSRELRITTVTNEVQSFPLQTIDARERVAMVREVYDRLNTAHGYTRFTFE
ncbi:hypothetical protein EHW97_04845 [Aeromicrobium camelliae]|uniref:Uncharacterized protein n=1 Tax=Aeromicrobium camelliae TaxID=1538144 RepID=A0A3N6X4I2_9ACTN|nr:hypothetical protein [Aeromicrobium camelliae]RQN09025.1 hypothetical protein EHW97_04845 [Aeromicrobium camelliae]